MGEVLSLIGLWIFVGLKFVIGPVTMLAYGLNRIEALLFVFASGTFWSVFYFYLGARIQQWYRTKFPSKKKKKVFKKSSRQLVRIKNKFGSWGFAFSIVLISIPISALLASKYFKHEKTIWLKYLLACAFWATVLTFFSEPITSYFKSLLG